MEQSPPPPQQTSEEQEATPPPPPRYWVLLKPDARWKQPAKPDEELAPPSTMKEIRWVVIKTAQDSNVFSAPSNVLVSQRGLFARRRLEKGTEVCYYTGVRLKHADKDDHYAVKFDGQTTLTPSRAPNAFDNPPYCKAALINDPRGTALAANVLFQAQPKHWVTFKTEKKDQTDVTRWLFAITVVAIRDIEQGEELLLDYGDAYWKGIPNDPTWLFPEQVGFSLRGDELVACRNRCEDHLEHLIDHLMHWVAAYELRALVRFHMSSFPPRYAAFIGAVGEFFKAADDVQPEEEEEQQQKASGKEEEETKKQEVAKKPLDAQRRKDMERLWAVARQPDNNLGTATVGPSPQMITCGSCIQVLTALDVDEKSRFIDIGSGHGLVSICAFWLFRVQESHGIELDHPKFEFANKHAAQYRENDGRVLSFQWGNITVSLSKLDSFDRIYSFDREFPPPVLNHIANLLFKHTSRWKFASSRNPETWKAAFDRISIGAWDARVRVIGQATGKISGSGESHTFWIYQGSNTVPTEEDEAKAREYDELRMARSEKRKRDDEKRKAARKMKNKKTTTTKQEPDDDDDDQKERASSAFLEACIKCVRNIDENIIRFLRSPAEQLDAADEQKKTKDEMFNLGLETFQQWQQWQQRLTKDKRSLETYDEQMALLPGATPSTTTTLQKRTQRAAAARVASKEASYEERTTSERLHLLQDLFDRQARIVKLLCGTESKQNAE
jgi:hypothetical protein